MRPESVDCLFVAGKAQGSADQPAHSDRVANANLIGARIERVAQRPLSVGHRAANVEMSSAAFRDVTFSNTMRVASKLKSPATLLKPAGKSP